MSGNDINTFLTIIKEEKLDRVDLDEISLNAAKDLYDESNNTCAELGSSNDSDQFSTALVEDFRSSDQVLLKIKFVSCIMSSTINEHN